MAKRSHHLMTALSKWQLGKLLGRGGLMTGGISCLFALIWSGRPHTIPVSLLCETAKSLSEQAGAGKTSLSWICITTLHVCRKKTPNLPNSKIKLNDKTQQIPEEENPEIWSCTDGKSDWGMKVHLWEAQPEGASSQRLSLHFYAPAGWDEALQVHKGRRAHRGI